MPQGPTFALVCHAARPLKKPRSCQLVPFSVFTCGAETWLYKACTCSLVAHTFRLGNYAILSSKQPASFKLSCITPLKIHSNH